jgi:hypothetical protein
MTNTAVEVITAVRRRWHWSRAEKERLADHISGRHITDWRPSEIVRRGLRRASGPIAIDHSTTFMDASRASPSPSRTYSLIAA